MLTMLNTYFKRKDGTKYLTKEEIYSQIVVYNPNTFMHHFQELDIPWVPQIWERYIQISIERGHNIASTFGKYYNYMNLWGLRGYRFKDSEELAYYWKS